MYAPDPCIYTVSERELALPNRPIRFFRRVPNSILEREKALKQLYLCVLCDGIFDGVCHPAKHISLFILLRLSSIDECTYRSSVTVGLE